MPKIEDDTLLLPHVIADCVCREAAHFAKSEVPMTFADGLAARAETVYANHPAWRRKLRRSDGRDVLAAFMRHWLAAALRAQQPAVFRALPQRFANGQA